MACQVCHDTATMASAEQAKGAALKESQTQWKAWTAKAVECEPCLPARGQTSPSVGSTACQGRGRSVVLRNKKRFATPTQVVARTLAGQAARMVHHVDSRAPCAPSHSIAKISTVAGSGKGVTSVTDGFQASHFRLLGRSTRRIVPAALRSRGIGRYAVCLELAHRGHAQQAHWAGGASGPSDSIAGCSVFRPRHVGTVFRNGRTAGATILLSRARAAGRRFASRQSTRPITQHPGSPAPPQMLRDGCSRATMDPGRLPSRTHGAAGSRQATQSRTLFSEGWASWLGARSPPRSFGRSPPSPCQAI